MYGPQEVADALQQLLAQEIEAENTRVTLELGPLAGAGTAEAEPELAAVPRVVEANAIDPLTVPVGDWPFSCVVPGRLKSMRRDDVTDEGGRLYVSRYDVQVWLYARGDGFKWTAAVRNRMVLLHRQVLLGNQHLRPSDVDPTQLQLDEATWTEDYSPVGLDTQLGATVAAAVLQFDVVAASVLAPTVGPVGVIENVLLSDTLLPRHPAL